MKTTKHLILLGGLLSLFLIGCSGATKVDSEAAVSKAPDSQEKYTLASTRRSFKTASNTEGSRNVIQHADLTMRVKAIEESEKKLRKMVSAAGGFVETANGTDLAGEHPTITMSIRVPVAQFENAIEQIESLGVRLEKSVSSEDVTSQVIAFQSQLQTLEAQEIAAKNQKADVGLAASIRSQIENLKSQQGGVVAQAAFSTIGVKLEQSSANSGLGNDPNWASEAWGGAFSTAIVVGKVLVTAAIWFVVFSPLWLPCLWIARKKGLLKSSRIASIIEP